MAYIYPGFYAASTGMLYRQTVNANYPSCNVSSMSNIYRLAMDDRNLITTYANVKSYEFPVRCVTQYVNPNSNAK